MEILLGSVVCLGVALLVLLWSPGGSTVRRRLDALAAPELPRGALLEKSFLERGLTPFVRFLSDAAGAVTPEVQRVALIRRLQHAGFNREHALEILLAAKVLGLAAGLATGWVLATSATSAGGSNALLGIVAGMAAAAIGLLAPDLWLRSRVARRKREIVNSLPHVVDLVTACVEAGLSFDAALYQVLPTLGVSDAAIREELGWYLADVGMGQSRQEALADLAERCGTDELKGLVAAILQGDQLGQGVGTTLRAQSLHLRIRRRQHAQEEAMKAPVKMLVPLVFFVFPAMFVVILGPATLQMVDILGRMVKQ